MTELANGEVGTAPKDLCIVTIPDDWDKQTAETFVVRLEDKLRVAFCRETPVIVIPPGVKIAFASYQS